jgi:hypothetical protein
MAASEVHQIWLLILEQEAGLGRSARFLAEVSTFHVVNIGLALLFFSSHSRHHIWSVFLRTARTCVSDAPVSPLACVAPLVGHGSVRGAQKPEALVRFAACSFWTVELSATELRRLGPAVVFKGEHDRVLVSRPVVRLERTFNPPRPSTRTGSSESMQTADVYVVFSVLDDDESRLAALCGWVERFEAQYGRSPLLWISSLCADRSLSRTELLEQLPVYLARSRALLVLAGPHLLASLWTGVECYLWHILGGRPEDIEIALAAPPHEHDTVAATFDSYHVMYTPTALVLDADEVHRRLLSGVDAAGVPHFNFMIRELVRLFDGRALPTRSSAPHSKKVESGTRSLFAWTRTDSVADDQGLAEPHS